MIEADLYFLESHEVFPNSRVVPSTEPRLSRSGCVPLSASLQRNEQGGGGGGGVTWLRSPDQDSPRNIQLWIGRPIRADKQSSAGKPKGLCTTIPRPPLEIFQRNFKNL